MSKKSCKQGLETLSKRLGEKYDEKYKLRALQLPILKSTRDSAVAKKAELEKKIEELEKELDSTIDTLNEAEKEIQEVDCNDYKKAKEWFDFLLSISEKIDSGKHFAIVCKGSYWDPLNSYSNIRAIVELSKFPDFKKTSLRIEYGHLTELTPEGRVVHKHFNKKTTIYEDVVIFDPQSKRANERDNIILVNPPN